MSRQTEYRSTSVHPADAVYAVMVDADYLRTRLERIGGPGATLLHHHRNDDGGTRFTVRQGLDAELLPSIVASLMPGDIAVERTETWTRRAAGHYEGTADVLVAGTPASAVAAMLLQDLGTGTGTGTATGAGSEYRVRTDVTVKVPFVGGKIEGIIAEQVDALLDAEARFTTQWLATPR